MTIHNVQDKARNVPIYYTISVKALVNSNFSQFVRIYDICNSMKFLNVK